MAESLVSVEVVSLTSGHHVMVHATDLGLHFRGSAVAPHHLITSASFRTTSTSVQQGTHVIDEIVRWRRENQPGGRNAGSVFVNPAPGSGSAGALIDAAGLRGYRSGGAMVSDKHANFIQADPGASADDIVNVNGGAIALGHPIGMSGNRLALTILHELHRRGGGVGAAALCGGGGQGDAIIVRTV
jgi:UDP-N-acetylenolpyruvoylglucosamine reductase